MNKTNKSKLLAFAVVAMFAIAIVPICADDSEAGPYGGISDNIGDNIDQKYEIPISVGQNFTYNFRTNLDATDNTYGTVTYTATSLTGFTFDATEKKLTGAFPESAADSEQSITITATWKDPEKKVTQTATQTLVFQVDADLNITKENFSTYVLLENDGTATAVGTKVSEFSYTGSGDIKLTQTGTAPFTAHHDSTNKKVTLSTAAGLAKGQYDVTYTLTNNTTGDADSITVTYGVFDEIAITNETLKYYTYEGAEVTGFPFEFVNSYDTDDNDDTVVGTETIAFTPKTDANHGVLTQNADVSKVDVDVKTAFDAAGKVAGTLTGDANSQTYRATMTVTGTISNNGSTEASTVNTATATMELIVYKSLQFLSAPAISNIATTSTAVGSNSMNLFAYIAGAKSVQFIWGDGTTSDISTSDVANTYAANHTYAQKGVYMITIKATNDMGTTTSKVMYSTDGTETPADPSTPETPAEEKKSFIDEHGWMFILFGVLTAGMIVAFFVLGYQHPAVIIAAVVFAILTVLCYLYVDFGGIIDAVKGLFDGKA